MLNADEERGKSYARAKQDALNTMADELLSLVDTPHIARRTKRSATGVSVEVYDNVERTRLQVDTRKWLLSKLAPKKYGDKLDVDHKGSVALTLSKDDANVL